MSGLAVKVVPQDVVYLNLVERDCPFETSTPGPASEPYDVYIVHHLTVALFLLRSTLAVLTVFPREALSTASLTEAAYRHIQLVAKGRHSELESHVGGMLSLLPSLQHFWLRCSLSCTQKPCPKRAGELSDQSGSPGTR